MSMFSLPVVIPAAFVGFALLSALYVLRNMFIPTRGKRIGAYHNPKKALLVMDIQESGSSRHSPPIPFPSNTPFGQMLVKVNSLIECFEHTDQEVAYVRQVFSNSIITRLHGGRILPGMLEPRICRWVNIINKNDFAKNRTDAFSNRKLEQFLIDQQVDEIYLVGLDAAFCVYYTALGALNRGYKVSVVADGVMTGRNREKTLARFLKKDIAVLSCQEALILLNKKP